MQTVKETKVVLLPLWLHLLPGFSLLTLYPQLLLLHGFNTRQQSILRHNLLVKYTYIGIRNFQNICTETISFISQQERVQSPRFSVYFTTGPYPLDHSNTYCGLSYFVLVATWKHFCMSLETVSRSITLETCRFLTPVPGMTLFNLTHTYTHTTTTLVTIYYFIF